MADVDAQALRNAAESTAHALDDLGNRATPAGTISNKARPTGQRAGDSTGALPSTASPPPTPPLLEFGMPVLREGLSEVVEMFRAFGAQEQGGQNLLIEGPRSSADQDLRSRMRQAMDAVGKIELVEAAARLKQRMQSQRKEREGDGAGGGGGGDEEGEG